jgi:DNA invertase Pin-like site-specific DNA recombinase
MMALIGYARVSTSEQNLDHQVDALEKAGCIKIFKEKASGKSVKNRPVLQECLNYLREGDILTVTHSDRISRSVLDAAKMIADFKDKKIHFKSLTEPFDTNDPNGEMVFNIMMSISQRQRQTISERTLAGLAAARARGRCGGRPFQLSPESTKSLLALHATGTPIYEIAKMFKITTVTVYQYINRAKIDGTYPTKNQNQEK